MLPIQAVAFDLSAAVPLKILAELGVGGLGCCQIKRALQFDRMQYLVRATPGFAPGCPHGKFIHRRCNWIDQQEGLAQGVNDLGLDGCLACFCFGKQRDSHDLTQAFPRRHLQALTGIARRAHFQALLNSGEGKGLITSSHRDTVDDQFGLRRC